ncbi:MAG: response regulator receiver [Ignavibacteria bacterium]|nr:MAG: response regulator receiver [Ignavibacteria bacterium]KAF0158102.1 MAG: response regulator receiver [Ignavibacteria bacterium]
MELFVNMDESMVDNNSIGLASTVEDLELTSIAIDFTDNLIDVYRLFDNNSSITGIIVLKNQKYFKLLSRNRFFNSMSNQFMYDLYLKRSVGFYVLDQAKEEALEIPRYTTVLEAANLALKRPKSQLKDPLVILYENGEVKLLDIYHLLLAQIHVHTLTLESLKKANEFKSEVLGMIAHDLRTPIGSIIGFSEELKDINNDDQSLEFLKYINTSAKQINEMVSELLSSVVNDSTQIELNVIAFNLNELIEAVVFSLNRNIIAKEQKIVVNALSEPIEIEADKIKIKEVIENLLTNAVKYSGFGCTTVVETTEKDSNVFIKVIDEGQGLSANDLKKIFGKFQRLSAKPTNGESSTGLGLYLAKQITERHFGTISVTSKVGVGTTFIVSLPKYYKQL